MFKTVATSTTAAQINETDPDYDEDEKDEDEDEAQNSRLNSSKNRFNSRNKQKQEMSFKFEFKSTKNIENEMSTDSKIEIHNSGGFSNFILKAGKKLLNAILSLWILFLNKNIKERIYLNQNCPKFMLVFKFLLVLKNPHILNVFYALKHKVLLNISSKLIFIDNLSKIYLFILVKILFKKQCLLKCIF